jgi:hypothetical protein
VGLVWFCEEGELEEVWGGTPRALETCGSEKEGMKNSWRVCE